MEHSFILMSCRKHFSQKTSFVVVTKRQKKLEISKGRGVCGGNGLNSSILSLLKLCQNHAYFWQWPLKILPHKQVLLGNFQGIILISTGFDKKFLALLYCITGKFTIVSWKTFSFLTGIFSIAGGPGIPLSSRQTFLLLNSTAFITHFQHRRAATQKSFSNLIGYITVKSTIWPSCKT